MTPAITRVDCALAGCIVVISLLAVLTGVTEVHAGALVVLAIVALARAADLAEAFLYARWSE